MTRLRCFFTARKYIIEEKTMFKKITLKKVYLKKSIFKKSRPIFKKVYFMAVKTTVDESFI